MHERILNDKQSGRPWQGYLFSLASGRSPKVENQGGKDRFLMMPTSKEHIRHIVHVAIIE